MSSKHVKKIEYTLCHGRLTENRVLLFDDRDYTEEQLKTILHEGMVYEERVTNKKLIDVNLQTYNNVFRSLLNGGKDDE